MKIATYNVNGINARLPVLLRWLSETAPDVACLQELKAPQDNFPEQALKDAGYSAIWHGQKSWNGVAILSRTEIKELKRGLEGDPDDLQSRYIEAVVNDIVIACLYLPNGNPAPGPKFDYKLNWFKRFTEHAAVLYQSGQPVVLTGDYNVIPTEIDVYKPERWTEDALFRPETREAFERLMAQGWTDAIRMNAGLRIDHFLLNPLLKDRLIAAGVDKNVRDQECYHLMLYQDNVLVAYSRLVPPGLYYSEAAIGRVITSSTVRGKGMGRTLMERSIKSVYDLFGKQDIRIGAQVYAQKFYESLGFVPDGSIYDEDGIDHVFCHSEFYNLFDHVKR
eukprot:gene815-819_t